MICNTGRRTVAIDEHELFWIQGDAGLSEKWSENCDRVIDMFLESVVNGDVVRYCNEVSLHVEGGETEGCTQRKSKKNCCGGATLKNPFGNVH